MVDEVEGLEFFQGLVHVAQDRALFAVDDVRLQPSFGAEVGGVHLGGHGRAARGKGRHDLLQGIVVFGPAIEDEIVHHAPLIGRNLGDGNHLGCIENG